MLDILFYCVGCYPLIQCVKGAKGRQRNWKRTTANEQRGEGRQPQPPTTPPPTAPPTKSQKNQSKHEKNQPPHRKKNIIIMMMQQRQTHI
jgi:hypothetical protein